MDIKVHKKKSKSNQKNRHKKSQSMVPNGDDASDNGDMALDELHSLTHYAGDEVQLVDHMLAAIQGTKLEAMMPPVLKAIPLQDLKMLCVHELRGISKKRIIAIIQGREMSDSSGSSDDEDDSGSEDDRSHKRRDGDSSHRRGRRGKSKPEEGDDGKPMDIVELEMRARLIQTMLKGDPKDKGSADPSDLSAGVLKVKNEPKTPRDSRSRSYSTSQSRSHSRSRSRSHSRSRSRSGSSYSSGSEGGRRRGSKRRSRRDRHHHKRGHESSSKKHDASRDKTGSVTPDRGEDGDSAKKRQQARKTKISRKEFEDRMRKAKENRTYRKRKDSEDEEKRSREEEVPERPHTREHRVKKEKPDVEEGEESEKEEGEIDSNEEEGTYYSDENVKSRKHRHRSRSRSSYSSISSSGSKRGHSKKKSKRSRDKRRSARGDVRMPVDKNLILATLNDGRLPDQTKGDSGKVKPGIETVDSEEDFDTLNGAPSRLLKLELSTNMVPRTDRTNVSFSFNKKSQPTLSQGTDLEFGRSLGGRPSSGLKPQASKGADQIVISSDSEGEMKSSKRRMSEKVGPQDVTGSAVVIDDDTNLGYPEKDATHNASDQNDLKLCEATVMKDIFADIDDDEDDDTTRIEVKRELMNQPHMMEVDRPGHPAINDATQTVNIRHTPPYHSEGDHESAFNSSLGSVTERDVCVKQEVVSPRREMEIHTPPPKIIKSEPWDDLGIPSQTNQKEATKSRSKKGKKGKAKKTIKKKEPATAGLLDSSLKEVVPRTVVEEAPVKESSTKSRSDGNDSEEGACTDQEADLNNSLLTENARNINSPSSAGDPPTCSPVPNNETMEDMAPENSTVDTSTLDSTYEKSPRSARAESPTPRSSTDGAHEFTDSNLNDPELSEEESGLIDLPEDEHFEIEDEDNSRDVPKYDASALETLHRELNDDEGNVDNSDFYRGVDGLNFSKENSRAGVEDEEPTLSSIPDNRENASEEGEVADEEEAEDCGLVELQPEEAEELTALADNVVPLPRQGNTEIIGEIDASTMEEEAGAPALGDTGSSWSSRWLQSEKVQKVVSSNKMLNRMRKRIIKNDKLNAAKSSPTAAVDPSVPAHSDDASALGSKGVDITTTEDRSAEAESVPVIGSLEEYKKMIAGQENAAVTQEEQKDGSATAAASEPVGNSSEDSEDDELWSKMMGN